MNKTTDTIFSKRFKTTLEIFQSYCQSRGQSLNQIKKDRNSNKSCITKYQSIRELKSEQYRKDSYFSRSSRKNTLMNKKKEESTLILKHSELIELIKLKLSSTTNEQLRMKTEYTENRHNNKTSIPSRRHFQFVNLNNKSIDFGKSFKKKKIDLVVKNSKYAPIPKQIQKDCNTEVIISLKKRPNSAIITNNRNPVIIVQTEPSFTPFATPGGQAKTMQMQKKQKKSSVLNAMIQNSNKIKQSYETDIDKYKDISGWEIGSYDDYIIPVEKEKNINKKVNHKKLK